MTVSQSGRETGTDHVSGAAVVAVTDVVSPLKALAG